MRERRGARTARLAQDARVQEPHIPAGRVARNHQAGVGLDVEHSTVFEEGVGIQREIIRPRHDHGADVDDMGPGEIAVEGDGAVVHDRAAPGPSHIEIAGGEVEVSRTRIVAATEAALEINRAQPGSRVCAGHVEETARKPEVDAGATGQIEGALR